MYKVLLVDDEGIVLDSLKFIINKNFGESCEIRTAKTGRQAIEIAQEFVPDISFMDIQMPNRYRPFLFLGCRNDRFWNAPENDLQY